MNANILILSAQTNNPSNSAFTVVRNIVAINSTLGIYLNVIPSTSTSVGLDPIVSVNLLVIRNIGQPWEY
jgi:hypothetical protein